MSVPNNVYEHASTIGELRPPSDTIKYYIRKIEPTSASTGASFPGSSISFRWTTSANEYTLLNRSWIVYNDKIVVPASAGQVAQYGNVDANNGIPPAMENDIAPEYLQGNALFNGYSLNMGGFELASVPDNAGQVSACVERLQRSGEWNKNFGYDTILSEPDFTCRQVDLAYNGQVDTGCGPNNFGVQPGSLAVLTATGVCTGTNGTAFTRLSVGDLISTDTADGLLQILSIESDTVMVCTRPRVDIGAHTGWSVIRNSTANGRNAYKNQRMFQPTGLGVWQQPGTLPPCSYELKLLPKSNILYKTGAVQSKFAQKVAQSTNVDVGQAWGTNNVDNVDYEITDIYLCLAVCERRTRGEDKLDFMLEIPLVGCQPRQISQGSQTQQFTVPRSTTAFSMALQDINADVDSRFGSTRFTAGNPLDPRDQRTLTSFQLSYDGQTKPSPPADFKQVDPEYKGAVGTDLVGGEDTSVYWGFTNMAINGLSIYQNSPANDYHNYNELGPLQHYEFSRKGGSLSTNLDLRVNYTAFHNNQKNNLLLFTHSTNVITATISHGQVSSFVSEQK